MDDPAIDLAVISAVLSSNFDLPIEKTVCFAGEVGLTGEIRAVNRLEQRISEAEKLGMTKIFVPESGKALDTKKFNIPWSRYPVSTISSVNFSAKDNETYLS